MRNGSIQMFEDYLDILIYVAHADHEVGAKELEEEVTEFSRGQLNVHLKRLAKADYLVSNNKKNNRAYTATDKTKQLFGVK
ncbi:hypothetical protein [Acinetobacter sp. ANC 3832]|uniref:hypothetical protein n=1 Tax=Acinetobacter sp. ANC 3832 TaxID=1977874 RepID=UPI000A35B943|nr:hypothetical protein [Acinetobacter sp. ANC 3832]OTG93680.1 hypothetical protein B9T35_08120 [Acinetobacter sp. ANC 3832]